MVNLIAPPYDVISADGLKALRARHEFNAVKLSLVDDPQDEERYQKMKARFEDWKARGAFEQDAQPCLYAIEENFTVAGRPARRLGFVALLETSPFADKQVLPHEHTLAGPKKDRFELLKTMGAELSQVFLCYQDRDLTFEKIFERARNSKPDLTIPEVDHVARKVWKITSPEDQRALVQLIASRPTLIADGHHRYETSLAFREFDQTDKSKYVQVYLTNLESPGFSIQPIHRLFSLPATHTPESLRAELAKSFEIKRVPQIDPEQLLQLRSGGSVALYLKFEPTKEVYLLTRKSINDEDAEIFVVQNEIFEKIFGWDVSKTSYGVLKYEHELDEFNKTLATLDRGVGVFLPPTDLKLVMKRAERGERMPQKSTYFYPKIASGLINYELGKI